MNNNIFLNWLFSDAGAGWVFGVISLIALIASYLRRKRTSKIIFKETYKSTLVKADQNIKDKIEITFDGVKVNKLSQLEVELYNDGSEVVKNTKIFVTFSEETTILDFSFDTPVNDYEAKGEAKNELFSFELPYLNPYREHKESVKLFMTLNGDIENIDAKGSGEGWSIAHLPTKSIEEISKIVRYRMVISLIATIFLSIFSVGINQTFFGIGFWEISLKSLLVTSPLGIVMLLLLLWVIQPTRGKNSMGFLFS